MTQGTSKVREPAHSGPQHVFGIPGHALSVFYERSPDEIVDRILLVLRKEREVEIVEKAD